MERDTIAAAVADVDTAHHTPDTEFSLRLIAAAAPAKNHPSPQSAPASTCSQGAAVTARTITARSGIILTLG